jgi:chemotaxis protein methyltransferase CheR
VLDKVRNILAPDGVLFLGAAETTLGLSEGWVRTTHGRTTINRVEKSGWQAGALSPSSKQTLLTQVGQG